MILDIEVNCKNKKRCKTAMLTPFINRVCFED